jgi:hypothetical protein
MADNPSPHWNMCSIFVELIEEASLPLVTTCVLAATDVAGESPSHYPTVAGHHQRTVNFVINRVGSCLVGMVMLLSPGCDDSSS